MNLDEGQRAKVSQWISEGLKLSEIQNRLASELGLRLTYMEVRLLVDDLKLTPADVEPQKPVELGAAAKGGAAQGGKEERPRATDHGPLTGEKGKAAAPGAQRGAGVAVAVDRLARPGALVSGKVTFSDGNEAEWYLDQTGRLGLVPQKTGYRPSAEDVQQFQMALESELSKIGF